MTFVDLIEASDCLYKGDGSSESEIEAAEKALAVNFASEYRSYLKSFSIVGLDGHQITGLSATPETHVVSSTEMGRRIIADADPSWYVIEIPNIDGIVVWQTPQGEIVQTSAGGKARVIAKSIIDYLRN